MKKLLLSIAAAALCLTVSAQQIGEKHESVSISKKPAKVEIKKMSGIEEFDGFSVGFFPPMCRQFYGIDKVEGDHLIAMEVYPADEELVWESLCEGIAAYRWTYDSPTYLSQDTSSEADLVVNYPSVGLKDCVTDPWGESLRPGGYVLNTPEVMVTSDDNEHVVWQSATEYLQIGGSAQMTDESTGVVTHYGLLPFCARDEQLFVYTPDNVPIFGYSPESEAWLTRHTLQRDPSADEFVRCDAIFNTIIPSSAPLTVDGARFFGRGKLNDDAVLEFLIYPTEMDGEFIYEPIATATCAVQDMIVTPQSDGFNIYEVPFMLDQAVVMSADESPFYLVGISGFYGAAEWFAPYQSLKPNPYELALGYYRCNVCYEHKYDDWYMWHVANFENDYGEMYSTFAICLDASYEYGRPVDSLADAIAPAKPEVPECDIMGRPLAPGYRGLAVKGGKLVFINE